MMSRRSSRATNASESRPPAEDGAAIEVDRAVNKGGIVSLAGKQVLAAEILGGRPVIVRIEAAALMFLDPDMRELLRVRPKLLPAEKVMARWR